MFDFARRGLAGWEARAGGQRLGTLSRELAAVSARGQDIGNLSPRGDCPRGARFPFTGIMAREERALNAGSREKKMNRGLDAEKNGSKPLDGSLDSVIRKMRGLGLFDGVDDPCAELMRERGVEVRK